MNNKNWPCYTLGSELYGEYAKWPKISIVTPSYNQADFIEETILSIINQNYPNLEFIIIDGGSRDGTTEIIKKYAANVTYWVSEPDKGQSDAINKGLKKCAGEIFNWINSDDYLAPYSLYHIGKAFIEKRFTCFCGITNILEREQIAKKYKMGLGSTAENTITNPLINQPGTFYNLSIVKKLGGVNRDLHYAMDYDLWIRFLLMNGLEGVYSSNEDIACFRIHELSKTQMGRDPFDREKALVNYEVLQSLGADNIVVNGFQQWKKIELRQTNANWVVSENINRKKILNFYYERVCLYKYSINAFRDFRYIFMQLAIKICPRIILNRNLVLYFFKSFVKQFVVK